MGVEIAARPRADQRRSRTGRWRVGSRVVANGESDLRWSERLVVGYKPDGRCMTVLLDPPPWMERCGVFLDDPESLQEA